MAGRKKQGAELSAPEIIEEQTPEVEPEESEPELSAPEIIEEQTPEVEPEESEPELSAPEIIEEQILEVEPEESEPEPSAPEIMEEQTPETDEPKQAVISAPNKNFHGVIGGISFSSGKAVIALNGDSKMGRMLAWFRENGYSVVVLQAVKK